MTTDSRRAIANALTAAAYECDGKCGLSERDCYDAHPISFFAMAGGITHVTGAVMSIADVAVAAIQDAYVPPPPGSDRDKLPDAVLARISMRPYLSSGCETAKALEAAARRESPDAELVEWARRMHASCRQTRKQDMAPCQCLHHQVRPIDAHLDEVGE